MEKIGIIAEYNPFHNGHLYHLNYIKKNHKDAMIILVMSGDFTERGDLSIINKWDKTKIALEAGIDVIVELPYFYAAQAADLFAHGALKILNEFKVDKIIFGSEANDKDKLISYANKSLTNEYDLKVKEYLKNGLTYPEATSLALDDKLFNTPNDILGLAYTKEIIKNKYPIEIETLKRTNEYNSLKLENQIVSASAIRQAIKDNQEYFYYVPANSYNYIKYTDLDKYFKYLKYRVINEKEGIQKYHLVDIKIVKRIIDSIQISHNFDELILNIKAKNYTYNYIKRVLVNILLGITKDDMKNKKDYIRLLGLSQKGKNYFNEIKKDIKLPIITSYTNDKDNLLTINTKIINTLAIEDKIYEEDFKNHTIIS